MEPTRGLSNESEEQTDEDLPEFYTDEMLVESLLILATKLRHQLTYAATQDIVRLHCVLADSSMKRISKHHWKKIVYNFSKSIAIRYLCCECNSYIGIAICQLRHCNLCNKDFDFQKNLKSCNVFIYILLPHQLRELFKVKDIHSLYSQKRQKLCEYTKEDIFDGKCYRSKVDANMISVNFSVDGVPVFVSSDSSIWAILYTVNELEPKQRKKKRHLM